MRIKAAIMTGLGALAMALAAQAEVTVTDDREREVRLEEPAGRIVALAPHIVENAFSAGAGDRLVAVVDHSDYPAPARDLKRLGGYRDLSAEAIVALEPDLVLLWGSGNGESLRRQLERLGVPVYVDEPRTLADVARSMTAIGRLAGTEAEGRRAARRYERRLAALRERYAERAPVSVLYQVWHEPLQTLNGDHLVSALIRLCGGRNAYADARPLAPKINMESVLERDPEAIVASGSGGDRPEWLDDWREWSDLTAVRRDNLFYVPPDLIQRHTARILDGSEHLCRHLETARGRRE